MVSVFPSAEAHIPSMQGRMANATVASLEKRVALLFEGRGYASLKTVPANPDRPYFIQQERTLFRSIYGTALRIDFYAWHPMKYPSGMVIECKVQSVPGSVDEKYPYAVLNMNATGVPAILIIEGGGAKEGAVRWCLQQQTERFRVYRGFQAFSRAVSKEGLL